MEAIRYIVDTLLWLLTLAFVLRLLFQWVRADFRDPMADAIVRVTNWLIMPLRRLLPPIGKIDTATVVAVLLAAAAAHRGAACVRRRSAGRSTAVPAHHARRAGRDDLADLSVRPASLLVHEFRLSRRLRARRPLACATVRTDLEAGPPRDPAHRTNRFLVPLGVDRDRRAVDTAALNMHSYMPENTANDVLGKLAAVAPDRRGSLKNQARARVES